MQLLYNGYPRTILNTFNTFKNILLSDIQIDVFFYLWDTNDCEINPLKADIINTLNPVEYKFASFNDIINDEIVLNKIKMLQKRDVDNSHLLWHHFPSISGPFIYSIYSQNQAFLLFEDYCNKNNKIYDIVVRVRTDMFWNANQKLNLILDNKVHIPTYHNYGDPPMCDLFGYGNFNSMKIYFNLYNCLDKLKAVHPESLLGEQLLTNNINTIGDIYIQFNLTPFMSNI